MNPRFTGSAAERLAARARLYGPTADELVRQAGEAIQQAGRAHAELRIGEPGALDRLDRLLDHIEGLRRYLLRAREKLPTPPRAA